MTTADELSEAIVLYIGRHEEKLPRERDGRVREVFGPRADVLLAAVVTIVHEVDALDSAASDPGRTYREVREAVATAHPELSAAAAGALAWRWSWQNR